MHMNATMSWLFRRVAGTILSMRISSQHNSATYFDVDTVVDVSIAPASDA